MKKLISMICALSMCAASGMVTVHASEEYTDSYGAVYTYNINSFGTGIIDVSLPDGADGVVIPSEINGTKVKSIDSKAFKNYQEDIKSITVTGNMNFKFNNMPGLTTVIIQDNVTELPDGCFAGCSSLRNVDLPDGLKRIGSSAFSECTALASITIPDGVEEIGNLAFSNCTSLKTVNWSHNCGMGLEVFLGSAYAKNTDFILMNNGKTLYSAGGSSKTVEIPSTVTEIVQFAFEDSRAEKIIFPESMKVIPQNAFYSAKNLKEVEFKGSINKMETAAFQNCTSLSKIIIPKGISEIPESCFADCTSLKEIIIPEGISNIGWEAFRNCTGITSISLPNTLRVIAADAFDSCTGLKEITIPASVQTIGERAFNRCLSLAKLTIEGNTTVDDAAFCQTALTENNIIINGKVTYTPIAKNKRYQKDAFLFMYGDVSAAELPATPSRKPLTTEEPEPTQKPNVTTEPVSTKEPISIATQKSAEEKTLNVKQAADGTIIVDTVDKTITFEDAQPFVDENGRTQIPIRAVAEALGCTVDWDDEAQTAILSKDSKIIVIKIGDANMQVGKEIITMDTTAQIINERTYIPVRFVGEALGMKVNWENK